MGDFFKPDKIPMGRIIVYGLIGVGVFAWVGSALHDPDIKWAGAIGIPVVTSMLLGTNRVANTQWAKQRLGLFIGVGIILQLVLLIWDFVDFIEKH